MIFSLAVSQWRRGKSEGSCGVEYNQYGNFYSCSLFAGGDDVDAFCRLKSKGFSRLTPAMRFTRARLARLASHWLRSVEQRGI